MTEPVIIYAKKLNYDRADLKMRECGTALDEAIDAYIEAVAARELAFLEWCRVCGGPEE